MWENRWTSSFKKLDLKFEHWTGCLIRCSYSTSGWSLFRLICRVGGFLPPFQEPKWKSIQLMKLAPTRSPCRMHGVCGHETLFHCIYMVFDYEFDQMLAYSKHNDYVIYGDATNYMNIEQYIDLLGLVLSCPLQPILVLMTLNLVYLWVFVIFLWNIRRLQVSLHQTFFSKLDGKSVTQCIYHPLDGKSFNSKVIFNVNISYNTNLA